MSLAIAAKPLVHQNARHVMSNNEDYNTARIWWLRWYFRLAHCWPCQSHGTNFNLCDDRQRIYIHNDKKIQVCREPIELVVKNWFEIRSTFRPPSVCCWTSLSLSLGTIGAWADLSNNFRHNPWRIITIVWLTSIDRLVLLRHTKRRIFKLFQIELTPSPSVYANAITMTIF